MADQTSTPGAPPADNPRLDASRKMYSANRERLKTLIPAAQKVAAPPVAPPPHARGEFRIQLVEPLFRQAVAYIGSVLDLEPLYRQLRATQTNIALDIEELKKLQDINDAEVDAGLFNLSAWSAQASLVSDQTAQTQQNNFSQWVQSQAPQQIMNAVRSAENNLKPFSKWTVANVADHTPAFYPDAKWQLSSDESKIAGKSAETWASTVGGVLGYRAAGYGFQYAKWQMDTQIAPIAARLAYVTKFAGYMSNDPSFREQRRNVAHNKLTERLAAIATKDGPLNYGDQLSAILGRAQSALNEANARLAAVVKGMRWVYGYDAGAIPALPAGITEALPSRYLSQLAVWTQNLGVTLQKLTQDDQSLVVRVSLKAQLGEDTFIRQAKAGEWDITFEAKMLSGLKFVRLRGLGAWLKFEGDIPPQMIVTAPSAVTLLYGRGATNQGNQSVNGCWLGRPEVWPGTTGRQPEIVGTSVLYNASPFGRWSVKQVPLGAGDVTDVIVEFYLVVQQDR
ncbi:MULTISPECIES: hypothetical protein [Paraburkholderia]|uniref:hypothetical protein n=1 Tax=Paraburkholderia TaxID=1822464 RepID=UPI002253A301|nr:MULTISPECIES: hypothetical protein [Paraburkholderia]MCX4175569.1 hypothetical protein [Paraburkholderia madseniana]MDQ6463566.1 hypothetical protein [Paraburkholderia madseniana]